MREQKTIIKDGITYKYHANGKTIFSKGKVRDGEPDGYWEWYRKDGTLKRSGYFDKGEPIGEWTTYDSEGEVYKVTEREQKSIFQACGVLAFFGKPGTIASFD